MSNPTTIKFKVNSGGLRGDIVVSLYRRQEGQPYHAYFRMDGKAYRKGTKQMVERLARQVAREMVLEALKEADASRKAHLSNDELKQKYWDSKPADFRTIRPRVEHFLNYANRNLLKMDLEEASGMIQAWIQHLQSSKDLMPQTVTNYRRAVSTFMGWIFRLRNDEGRRLVDWPLNPAHASLIEMPKIRKKEPEPLDDKTLEHILNITKHTKIYPVIVLLLSGCRPKGIFRAKWRDIDFDNRILHTDEKSVDRVWPLSKWAATELRAWLKEYPKQPGDNVSHYVYRRAQAAFQSLREMSGLDDSVTFARLRKTADFTLYKAGVSPQEAAAIMGHSPSTAQKHYVNWKKLTSHKAADALDFSKKTSPEEKEKNPKPEDTEGKKLLEEKDKDHFVDPNKMIEDKDTDENNQEQNATQ